MLKWVEGEIYILITCKQFCYHCCINNYDILNDSRVIEGADLFLSILVYHFMDKSWRSGCKFILFLYLVSVIVVGEKGNCRNIWRGKWTKGFTNLLIRSGNTVFQFHPCKGFCWNSAGEFPYSLMSFNCSHKPNGRCCHLSYLTNESTVRWNALFAGFLKQVRKIHFQVFKGCCFDRYRFA